MVQSLGRTATRRYLTLDDTAVLSARKVKKSVTPVRAWCCISQAQQGADRVGLCPRLSFWYKSQFLAEPPSRA